MMIICVHKSPLHAGEPGTKLVGMYRLISIALWIIGLAALPHSSLAQTFVTYPEVTDFIHEMHTKHDFDVDQLTDYFAQLSTNPLVLRYIKPADSRRKRAWTIYRASFINAQKINAGLHFWKTHAAALHRAQEQFGVPAEIIVAIIGIETAYGQNTGKFGVMEALATLAFDYPPRAAFFRNELTEYLLMTRDNQFHPLRLRGSYAGAIGIPQFMPSSQRRYAIDFDGDGQINLIDSPIDAIGSVARFLAQHGWEDKGIVAVPAKINGDPAPLLSLGIKPERTLAELRLAGISAEGDANTLATLIDLPNTNSPPEYWVGFQNFYVITRYNRSSFYAMSVFQLAQILREKYTAD